MEASRFVQQPGVTALTKLRAIRDSSLTLTQAALCIAVVLRENSATGETWAGIPTLARDAKIAERTAWRDCKLLRKGGVLKVVPRSGRSSVLSVNLSALRSLARKKTPARSASLAPHASLNQVQPTPAGRAKTPAPSARTPAHRAGKLPLELAKQLPNKLSRFERVGRRAHEVD